MPALGLDLSRPAPEVAPDLLGCVLRVGEVAIRLTEVEAYAGTEDPASHAFRGPTARTRVMFGPPGHLYIYLSYGIHSCVNVVCGPEGTAGGCLVRAGEVVEGIDVARARRGLAPGQERRLAKGPGCVGQAFGVLAAESGLALDGLRAELRPRTVMPRIQSGPRVGVSRHADVAWRFWIAGDPTVSAYSRSSRAPRLPDATDPPRPGSAPGA